MEVAERSAADERRVGTGVRVFAYGFLAVVLVAALASLEYWPITGWRLYVEPRKPTHPSWELETVDGRGSEQAVSLYDLPIAYRNTDRQLRRSGAADAARADAVCRAWLDAFSARDASVAILRIYRTRVDARSGEKLDRRLVHECGAALA